MKEPGGTGHTSQLFVFKNNSTKAEVAVRPENFPADIIMMKFLYKLALCEKKHRVGTVKQWTTKTHTPHRPLP